MRDVSRKVNSLRTAKATAMLKASEATIKRIQSGDLPKANPLEVARVAGIQAAKNTSQIIPYCHPLPVEYVSVDFALGKNSIEITTVVKAIYKTGVEMEALTAASVAALTVYDMLKIIDQDMVIEQIVLKEKTGGKSDYSGLSKDRLLAAAVLVMSDRISKGEGEDRSGKLIVERLKAANLQVVEYKVIADDREEIKANIKRLCEQSKCDLVVTTGGTGISPRDVTFEAISELIERPLPGIAEAMRAFGQERNPYAMLSRSLAGVRGKTIILALPGSTGGVTDSLDAVFPAILHAFGALAGAQHELEKAKA